MRSFRCVLVSCFFVSCGGTSAPSIAPTSATDHPPVLMSDVREWNRVAGLGAVTETVSGVAVADPYRALEIDTPETQQWIRSQNARSEAALSSLGLDVRAQRLKQLLAIGAIASPVVGGDTIFYTKREGEREQPLLYAKNGSAEPVALIDPLTFGERASLDWFYPSPKGTYLAFGISENGDEKSVLRVMRISDKTVLSEAIGHTKWSNVSWLFDETGFYFSRYPKEGEPNFDPAAIDGYFPRLFFHKLGTDPATDPLVYGSEQGTDFPGAEVSEDDRWVTISVSKGWSENQLYLFDRGRKPRARAVVPTDGSPLVHLTHDDMHSLTMAKVVKGTLYLLTNEGAPKYRVMKTRADRPSIGMDWTTVVAEREESVESWTVAKDRILLHYVRDVRSEVRVFGLDGREIGEVALPGRGSVDSLTSGPTGVFAFQYNSYLQPPSLLSVQPGSLVAEIADAVVSPVDLSGYALDQEKVASKDGTLINVYILHKVGVERNSEAPVLLTGYGGFNVSLLPAFSRTALYWLEKGGVYAVANLRGGAEYGEAWHQAGNLLNKTNVFDDFESVIRWFSSSGWSRPGRIAITGGSNGGLLVGALVTRAPDTFRAAVGYVGLYDMARYEQFPPAELWASEYGSAANAEQLRYLLSYSPYHQVQDGTAYPSVWIETADHDSRVHWGHSTKFAARLQQATSSLNPVYFYMVKDVGHGAGTRLSDSAMKYARLFAFVEHELGM